LIFLLYLTSDYPFENISDATERLWRESSNFTTIVTGMRLRKDCRWESQIDGTRFKTQLLVMLFGVYLSFLAFKCFFFFFSYKDCLQNDAVRFFEYAKIHKAVNRGSFCAWSLVNRVFQRTSGLLELTSTFNVYHFFVILTF